jgi:hypothetical protein
MQSAQLRRARLRFLFASSLRAVHALPVASKGSHLRSSVPTPRNVAGKALPRVSAHVMLEIAAISCSIPTPNHLTGKGALSRVKAHVNPESATLRRSIPTPNHLTGKGTLSRVSAHVSPESASH